MYLILINKGNRLAMDSSIGNLSESTNIKEIISDRKIRWLCHFTPRHNLKSIKEKGLIPRDILPENILFTDQSRFDKNSNAICLSISKPNKWMFKKKQNEGFDLCLILIDPAILLKECLFFQHNAATKSYRYMDNNNFKGFSALKSLFDNEISYQKSGDFLKKIYRNDSFNISETTSDQAEVQCLETIEPQYIKYIFESNIPLTYKKILEEVNKLDGVKELDFNIKVKNNFKKDKVSKNKKENNENESKKTIRYIDMMKDLSIKYNVNYKKELTEINFKSELLAENKVSNLYSENTDNYMKIVNDIKLKYCEKNEKSVDENKLDNKSKIKDWFFLAFIIIVITYFLLKIRI